MKDTCHNSGPKICAQLMLAIYITYGKRLTLFLAHSRNIMHECHPTPRPPHPLFPRASRGCWSGCPASIPVHVILHWITILESRSLCCLENRLLHQVKISKIPWLLKCLLNNKTLRCLIFTSKKKNFLFIPRSCTTFQLRARFNPLFFCFLFSMNESLTVIKELKKWRLWKQDSFMAHMNVIILSIISVIK